MDFKIAIFCETAHRLSKFQIPQLSESNFTKVGIRHPKKIGTSFDKILIFKIAHFIERNRSYQPARFHWPMFSGSNFTRLTRSQKAQSKLTALKGFKNFIE